MENLLFTMTVPLQVKSGESMVAKLTVHIDAASCLHRIIMPSDLM